MPERSERLDALTFGPDICPDWLDPVAVARAVHAHRTGMDGDQTRAYIGRALHTAERAALADELVRLRHLDGPVAVNWSLADRAAPFPVTIPAPRQAVA